MPVLEDLFTPIDELRIREPSYFASSPVINTNSTTMTFTQKTPVAALEEGARRVYGVPPEYQLICHVPNFGYSCRLMGKTVKGDVAKTKKLAKHYAAKAMLHDLIDKDRQVDFGIPGATKEEAHRIVDGMMIGDPRNEAAEEESSSPIELNENCSGELQQLCQKKKFEAPFYSYREEGPPNDRIFITTCRVVGQEVEGVAKTKKKSKNIASKKMLAILKKGIADMNEGPDFDKDMDDDVSSSPVTLQCDAPVVEDAVEMVTKVLSDSSKYESPMQNYRILDNKCAFGLFQCLLKITFSKPGEPQSRSPYVFPGSHSTEEGAKQEAARRALRFLSL